MNSTSQCSKILKLLKKNYKYGVANYRFPQLGILKYSSRISDLRRDGYNIVAERQILHGRYTGVWFYHLIEEGKPNGVDRLRKLYRETGHLY